MRHRIEGNWRLNLVGWAAALLIGAGAVLIVLFAAARLLLSLERNQAIESFTAARRAQASARLDTAVANAGRAAPGGWAELRDFAPNQVLWSEARIAAFAETPSSSLVPEGILRIPAVHIEVPVYPGTAELNLNRGAGRVDWTPPLGSSGNVGVAAHRDGFFRPLKDIEIGDEVVVELLDSVLRYEVTGISIVDPSAVEVLAPTPEPVLTLITCYPFYYVGSAPKRFIVQAVLAGGVLARN